MRIAMVGCRGIPAGVGGVERVVQELAIELAALGHEVFVYGRSGYTRANRDAAIDCPIDRCDRIKLITTAGLPGKGLEAFTHSGTAMLDALRRNVDVIHVHSPGPAIWSFLPDLAGKPIVMTVHAPDWQREKWSAVGKFAIKAGLSSGMKHAAVVTAVGQSLAGDLAAQFHRQVTYIPNAIRSPEPPNALSDNSDVRKDLIHLDKNGILPGQYVLNVGRIVPEKRLDLLLRAWRLAAVGRTLVVVGELEKSQFVQQCRKLAEPDPLVAVPERRGSVLFVGPQHGCSLDWLYDHAAMVVQPSALEGMSMVLLEAAARGKTILAADIPANRDVMANHILYFVKDSLDDLVRLIRRHLAQGNCQSAAPDEGMIGPGARQWVLSTYQWPTVARRYEAVYHKAMTGTCK